MLSIDAKDFPNATGFYAVSTQTDPKRTFRLVTVSDNKSTSVQVREIENLTKQVVVLGVGEGLMVLTGKDEYMYIYATEDGKIDMRELSNIEVFELQASYFQTKDEEKTRELNAKVFSWLQSGATSPLPLSEKEIENLYHSGNLTDFTAECTLEKSADNQGASSDYSIVGFKISIKGDLQLINGELRFVNFNGYNSTNSHEENQKRLLRMKENLESRSTSLLGAANEVAQEEKRNTEIVGLKSKSGGLKQISDDFRTKD